MKKTTAAKCERCGATVAAGTFHSGVTCSETVRRGQRALQQAGLEARLMDCDAAINRIDRENEPYC